jgi:hypothetical protein
VSPIPEHAWALGLGGGRVKTPDLLGAIRDRIKARYKADDYIYKFDDNGVARDGFINGNIYFNYAALERDKVNAEELAQVVGNAALSVAGVARYFTRAQLLRGATSITDPIERRVLHGFYPSRSGDVVLIAEPYKYLGDTLAATHGSAYSYDTNCADNHHGRGCNSRPLFRTCHPAGHRADAGGRFSA